MGEQPRISGAEHSLTGCLQTLRLLSGGVGQAEATRKDGISWGRYSNVSSTLLGVGRSYPRSPVEEHGRRLWEGGTLGSYPRESSLLGREARSS